MEEHLEEHDVKTVPGWVCALIGVGFVAMLVGGLVAVRVLSG